MRSYCLTDIGTVRKMNQDFVYASDQPVGILPNLYIVADGMGGHAAGDYASRCAVETMVDYIENASSGGPVTLLGNALAEANRRVMEKSLSDRSMEGMGTTLVAAVVQNDCLYVANVGDSRLYLIDDRLEQVTRDHSLVEEMVRAGELRREDARLHPDKNVITRAVGVKNSVAIDFFDVALNRGDRFLICSDGLTNMVPEDTIFRIVKEKGSLEAAAKELVDEANRSGGNDNISVILAAPDVSGD
ncbi:MAG: Stp1/IreP family PP2C-type Ser/Thr phosphatase [Lachnospiraceae bacterium]|nr:Stp1/IreP family PP2C-type Ser/Thr phosphatase [Lachnospiraceae bacterium]